MLVNRAVGFGERGETLVLTRYEVSSECEITLKDLILKKRKDVLLISTFESQQLV